MQKINTFLTRYGIPFHSISLVFWIWLLLRNFQNLEQNPETPKAALYISIALVVLTTLNLAVAIARYIKKR